MQEFDGVELKASYSYADFWIMLFVYILLFMIAIVEIGVKREVTETKERVQELVVELKTLGVYIDAGSVVYIQNKHTTPTKEVE